MRDAVKSRSAIGLKRMTALVYLATSFFVLSWAKDFLLPIILAILISFLLAPVVTRLEKFGLHPITEQPFGSGQQFAESVIVPFIGEGDELVGSILERLSGAEGITSVVLPWRMLRVEKLQRLQELRARCVVISAIEARSVLSVGKMARSIRSLLQDAAIMIGLWSLPREGSARLVKKISESQACNVYTNLDQAI